MKIGVFMAEDPHHRKALSAFTKGARRHGADVTSCGLGDGRIFDVAVVFGMRKNRVPASWPRGKIFDRHRERCLPVVVIDSGYVRRHEHFMVGFNGLNNRAVFRNEDMPDDRWKKLGVPLQPWWSEGKHIVVCGQVPWDASVQNSDHLGWCQSTVAALDKLTQRPILFRPHPAVAASVNYAVGGRARISTAPLNTDLQDCHALVTFSSNASVDAVIAGTPCFVIDRGGMAWDVSVADINSIESPFRPVREQWASNLAYTQWNIDELRDGEAWEHLFRRGVKGT